MKNKTEKIINKVIEEIKIELTKNNGALNENVILDKYDLDEFDWYEYHEELALNDINYTIGENGDYLYTAQYVDKLKENAEIIINDIIDESIKESLKNNVEYFSLNNINDDLQNGLTNQFDDLQNELIGKIDWTYLYMVKLELMGYSLNTCNNDMRK